MSAGGKTGALLQGASFGWVGPGEQQNSQCRAGAPLCNTGTVLTRDGGANVAVELGQATRKWQTAGKHGIAKTNYRGLKSETFFQGPWGRSG